VEDDATLDRIRTLAIPPAWQDVWICADPSGHLQATGTDAAGRRQYLYHEEWRRRRDRAKYRRMEAFGESIPQLRRMVTNHLALRGYPAERVLAGATRLLDTTALRIGTEEYERRHGSHGLATLRRDHVRISGEVLTLRFPGKSGVDQRLRVRDAALATLIRGLRRAHDAPEILAWRDDAGWHDIRAADINAYLHDTMGNGYTAKDFRTWHATVLAASVLAGQDPEDGKRAVTASLREVAEQLGNTTGVVRASYVDPRVIDRFLDEGRTIEPTSGRREDVEAAVLALITEAG
jgi:DNA topoisomerase IB